MKKNILVLILLIMYFILPVSLRAENKIYFDKEEVAIEPGKTSELTIYADSDEDFSAISFNVITTSKYVDFASVEIDDNFTRIDGTTGYTLKSKDLMKSGSKIATITLKSSNNAPIGTTANIRIINSSLTSDQQYNLPISETKVVVDEQKPSNYLLNLSSNLVDINFDKEKLVYNVEVEKDVKEFDLKGILEDSDATLNISSQKLTKKKNTIIITVSRQGLADRIYKVIVTKKTDEKEMNEVNNEFIEEENSGVKKKWIPILIILFIFLIFDLLILKKRKH